MRNLTLTPTLSRKREREFASSLSLWERARVRVN
jgi:hypothetical protein